MEIIYGFLGFLFGMFLLYWLLRLFFILFIAGINLLLISVQIVSFQWKDIDWNIFEWRGGGGGSADDDSMDHLSSNSPNQPEQEDRYTYEIQQRTRDSSWYRTIQTSGSEYQAILTAESLANRGNDGYSYRVIQRLNGRSAGCIWTS